MASYLDQIPKQLSARRKALRAASENPALLPTCWSIVRSIANNMFEYSRNSVVGGCTFPDRPIYLSMEDTAFLNFGATPKLLTQDSAWQQGEEAGQKTPDPNAITLTPDRLANVRKQLAQIARLYGTNQTVTRVFNLEPWIQAMYRDRLDVDFAEDLERQINALNQYMDSVPKTLAASGLSNKLAKGVMDAFNLFKTITGSSHQLDREKMSFVDRRSYVNTIQKIELIMTKADESLGSAMVGRSVVRELFELWKDANYEMMALTRQLRALWAGTSLDDRIQELTDLHFAVQKAINRCTEETSRSAPQLPAVIADRINEHPCSREDIEKVFACTMLFDIIVPSDHRQLRVREIRRYGPLSVVVTPGTGHPRYCWEIRKVGNDEEETARSRATKVTQTQVFNKEREMDVDRRVRYPLNCIVVPVETNRERLIEYMADAWLEYHQHTFRTQFKEFSEAAKNEAAEAFVTPDDKKAKDPPPFFARQMLSRLVGAFVHWAYDGTEPTPEDMPGFEAFRKMALARLNPDDYLIPLQYRPLIELFAEAGTQRRLSMWKRCLGPRYTLDRQLVAVSVLMKDWNALAEHLRYLPTAQTKDLSVVNGFAKAKDLADPFGEHKAIGFFRKFLTEYPDLKSAMVTVESQVAVEVETLRTQSESLGKVFQYDAASVTMLRRQMSLIQEKRLAANKHIDHHLTGLMYAMEGNLEAAEATLSMCLQPENKRTLPARPSSVPDEVGEEWFQENIKPLDGKFEKRPVPGEDSGGTVCYDLIYYNLGLVYQKTKRFIEASMCFCEAQKPSSDNSSFLCRQWAAEHAEKSRAQIPKDPDDESVAS